MAKTPKGIDPVQSLASQIATLEAQLNKARAKKVTEADKAQKKAQTQLNREKTKLASLITKSKATPPAKLTAAAKARVAKLKDAIAAQRKEVATLNQAAIEAKNSYDTAISLEKNAILLAQAQARAEKASKKTSPRQKKATSPKTSVKKTNIKESATKKAPSTRAAAVKKAPIKTAKKIATKKPKAKKTVNKAPAPNKAKAKTAIAKTVKTEAVPTEPAQKTLLPIDSNDIPLAAPVSAPEAMKPVESAPNVVPALTEKMEETKMGHATTEPENEREQPKTSSLFGDD